MTQIQTDVEDDATYENKRRSIAGANDLKLEQCRFIKINYTNALQAKFPHKHDDKDKKIKETKE